MKTEDIIKKQKILEYINSEEYMKITAKKLAVIFDIKEYEKNVINEIMDELVSEGNIYIDDSKRICLTGENDLFVCKYESKSRGFGFGRIMKQNKYTEGMHDIHISRDNVGTTLNEDIILVKIIEKPKDKNPEGKVIEILKRSNKDIVCIFERNDGFGFASPIQEADNDIYIPGRNIKEYQTGDRVKVKITRYPGENKKSEGIITELIGNESTKFIERLTNFAAYGINEQFSQSVENEAIKVTSEDVTTQFKNRIDLRDTKTYTIDGADAKDLDDAVFVKKNDDDTYTLSVHIADVSHYVKWGSSIDKEAVIRGTSIYTPGKVVPMLPKMLSNGICSLNENEPRLTLSCDMIIDSNGKVIFSNIYKGIIKVTKKMTYEKVEEVLERSNIDTLKEYADYIEDIEIMKVLAKILREKRFKNGSINFDIPESKITLDDNGDVVDVRAYSNEFSNKIIEEFMLVANETVAQTFNKLTAPFIYRVHENPDIDRLRELNEVLVNMGTPIKGINKIHPKAIADVMEKLEQLGDKQKSRVASTLILRSLKLARYCNECLGHFGLSFKYYCHFTSPIRRYPDLFIHRVISEYIQKDYNVEDRRIRVLNKDAENYAYTSSVAEKKATEIERDFDDLYKAIYIKKYIGEKFTGTISSVTKYGMYVELENTVEGMVTMSSMQDDYYIFDEKNLKLIGQRTSKTYEIGQVINIIVTKADEKLKQIDFEIIGE